MISTREILLTRRIIALEKETKSLKEKCLGLHYRILELENAKNTLGKEVTNGP